MDGPDTIISGPDSIMDTSDAIISGLETIVSTAEIVFPKGDTIISAFHTSFLAAAISVSAAEKTVGAVPAGLFLNHQPLNIRLAFDLMAAAKQLETAHESSLVPRDLKPANIKLAADGRVKVLDDRQIMATKKAQKDTRKPFCDFVPLCGYSLSTEHGSRQEIEPVLNKLPDHQIKRRTDSQIEQQSGINLEHVMREYIRQMRSKKKVSQVS